MLLLRSIFFLLSISHDSLNIDLCEVMPEPIAITLDALALLDPAIKACRKAYKVYKLTRHFGQRYVSNQRRVRGEQARVELILETRIACVPNTELYEIMIQELGSLQQAFQDCQDLVASIDRPQSKHISSHSNKKAPSAVRALRVKADRKLRNSLARS